MAVRHHGENQKKDAIMGDRNVTMDDVCWGIPEAMFSNLGQSLLFPN